MTLYPTAYGSAWQVRPFSTATAISGVRPTFRGTGDAVAKVTLLPWLATMALTPLTVTDALVKAVEAMPETVTELALCMAMSVGDVIRKTKLVSRMIVRLDWVWLPAASETAQESIFVPGKSTTRAQMSVPEMAPV